MSKRRARRWARLSTGYVGARQGARLFARLSDLPARWTAGLVYQEAGVDYIASLLQGYENAPKDVALTDGQYYNIYMPGRRLGMIRPCPTAP